MRRRLLIGQQFALAHDEHRSQRGKTGADMHHRTTCKIHHAHVLQETAAPHPVDQWNVDNDRPEDQEYQVAFKVHPVGKRTGDQRRCDDGKHLLVDEERQRRDDLSGQGIDAHARQGKVAQVANDAAQVFAECQAESAKDPDGRDDAQRNETLHHDRKDVLAAHQPTVKKRQPRGHNEHQGGTN